eukprot:EG_transcript_38109
MKPWTAAEEELLGMLVALGLDDGVITRWLDVGERRRVMRHRAAQGLQPPYATLSKARRGRRHAAPCLPQLHLTTLRVRAAECRFTSENSGAVLDPRRCRGRRSPAGWGCPGGGPTISHHGRVFGVVRQVGGAQAVPYVRTKSPP